MQRNKSAVTTRAKTGGSGVEVNTKTQEKSEGEMFTMERCITYTVGKRFVSLNISKLCDSTARVNGVSINLAEITGKGSFANLILTIIRDARYGVLCSMDSNLWGSYELHKKNYCVPPLGDTELVYYHCRETGAGGYLTLEKKKDGHNSEVVERVKYTHAFLVDDETTLSVKVKITKDRSLGLCVEVEGPITLTVDYSEHMFRKITEKMESEMFNRGASLFRKGITTNQRAHKGTNGDHGSLGGRKTVSKCIRSMDVRKEISDDDHDESDTESDY